MSERSFAAWSVGVALVFALVVPEPGKAPAPADTWQAEHVAPAAPALVKAPVAAEPMTAGAPSPVERKVRVQADQQAFLSLLARSGADFTRADLATARVKAATQGVLPK